MVILIRLALLALACAACLQTWADGKVFARAIPTSVTTPDQRALLYFSNGVERLVIETSFVGKGTNFAWVIPLPNRPQIEAVSSNFFSALSTGFQPLVIHEFSWWWLTYAWVATLIAYGIWKYRNSGAAGCLSWAIIALLLMLVAAIAIPNFVKARSTASSTGPVQVLDRQSVGIFDTVTLSGADANAVLGWLNSHGFYTSSNALPAFAKYAAEGWVFAAAVLNRDRALDGHSRAHPLVFTFASAQPIYPLRLTGVENGECTIELFVFGPGRAEAAGFRVEYCGEPVQNELTLHDVDFPSEFFTLPKPGDFRFSNPEIRRLAFPAAVTTKLVGKLTAKTMENDALLRWVPFHGTFPVLHTWQAALGASLDWFVLILATGLLCVQFLAPRIGSQALKRAMLGVLLAGAVCGLTRLAAATITEAILVRWSAPVAINNWRQVDGALEQYYLEWTKKKDPPPRNFDQLKTGIDQYVAGRVAMNSFDGKPLRNEPTPGNLTLEHGTNGVTVLWHDITGSPHPMLTFTNLAK